jgi:hypothetical protein
MSNYWMLTGSKGVALPLYLHLQKAIAKIVREEWEFEYMASEYGVPKSLGTTVERLEELWETVRL